MFSTTVSSPSVNLTQINPNQCAGQNFSHAQMGEQEIYSEFSGAVFRIEVLENGMSSSTGTGYLIDAYRGYVLTAFHVVELAYGSKSGIIHATSPSLPGEVLQLEIVNRLDKPQDVALLKVRDVAPLVTNHIRALDIAIHFFPPGVHYFTIGYPRGKSEPNQQMAELQGRYEDNYFLDVKQDVDNGSSGSPLIDENGAVLATCVDLINKSEALYTPMMYVEELLQKIPPDDSVDSLDKAVKRTATETSLRYLIERLRWKSGNATNLELYEWASKMTKGASFDLIRPYVSCPIVPAYSDRRLNDSEIVQRISSLALQAIRAKVLEDSANQELFLGRYIEAKTKARQALKLYRDIQDSSGETQTLTLLARADLYSGQLENASRTFFLVAERPITAPEKARTKAYLALTSERSGDSKLAFLYAQDALPALHMAKDDDGQVIAYETLGRVAMTKRNYKDASIQFKYANDLCKEMGDISCPSVAAELAQVNTYESHISFLEKTITNHWILIPLSIVSILSGWAIFMRVFRKKRRLKSARAQSM